MTPKRKLVYDFIQMFIKVRGFAPSYVEIAHGLGMTSKSNIHRHVHWLKKQGLLHVKPHRMRSLRLIDSSVRHIVNL